MKVIHDELLEATLIFNDDSCPVCRLGTPMESMFPSDILRVSLRIDAPGCNGDMSIPHVFGAVFPQDSHGLLDFNGQPEYKELKVTVEEAVNLPDSQKIVLTLENTTGETVNPGYIFVFA
jgi:hypothetical protein